MDPDHSSSAPSSSTLRPEASPVLDAGDPALHGALRRAPAGETARLLRQPDPMPVVRRGFFSDQPDKGLFVAFSVAGIALVMSLKFAGMSPWLAAGAAVFAITGYAALAYRQGIRPDTLGDNCYYMGFLFTLTSLAVALIALSRYAAGGRDDLLEALIGGFGVALFSTIWGIFLRVFFLQMRQEIADLEEQLRNELQNSASLLKDQLAAAVMDLENLRLRTSQVLDRHVEDASAGFAEVGKRLVEHVSNAGAAYRQASENLAKNAAQVASEIERLVNRVDQIRVPPDLVTKQVEDARTRIAALAEALERAAAAGAQRIEEARTRIESIATALQGTADSAAVRQDSLSKAAEALDTFIQRAAHVSVFGNVQTSVASFGQSIEAAVEKLSAASERLERYVAAISHAATQIDESADAASRAKAVIAEDLRQSTEALHKLQATLAEVADALVARVSRPSGIQAHAAD
jgi:methyl-accepting chemotaxis protein